MELMVQALRFHCLPNHLSQFHMIPVFLGLVCLSYGGQDAKLMECLNTALPISFSCSVS